MRQPKEIQTKGSITAAVAVVCFGDEQPSPEEEFRIDQLSITTRNKDLSFTRIRKVLFRFDDTLW
jgi:hypothetical protein